MKDKPGSGKTYVVLSMLNELKKIILKIKKRQK
jgi:Ni2+-binding GTPase involved in maturation of urease and hydrogenase